MIDKRLIYAWFGRKEKPNLVKKCINTWTKILPDYEIIELNEDTCDVFKYQYSKSAYEAKKWAFVADCMKIDYLYNNGGIIIDSDVEILKPFSEEMLNLHGFTSQETTGLWISAVLGCEKESLWIKHILNYYIENDFKFSPSTITNTVIWDKINRSLYKKTVGDVIYLKHNIAVFPRDYFECKNWLSGLIEITPNSYSIHHYTASWLK